MGVRRTPRAKDVKDTFCLNMFYYNRRYEDTKTGTRFIFSARSRTNDAFMGKGGEHIKIFGQNRWAESYLPNAWREKMQDQKTVNSKQQIERKKQFNHPLFTFLLFTLYFARAFCSNTPAFGI